MKKVLVAYSTNAGSTAEVAQAIGAEISKRGRQVDVFRLEEVASLDPYDVVIVGAPMILGWHRPALQLFKAPRAGTGPQTGGLFLHADEPHRGKSGWRPEIPRVDRSRGCQSRPGTRGG